MADDAFSRFLLDQLGALDGVGYRRMFGGYGLYRGTVFFGIVHDDTVYFKTDEVNRPTYVARGMEPFRPNPRQTLRSYYEVPADVVDDRHELLAWAREAVRVQERSPAAPRRRARR